MCCGTEDSLGWEQLHPLEDAQCQTHSLWQVCMSVALSLCCSRCSCGTSSSKVLAAWLRPLGPHAHPWGSIGHSAVPWPVGGWGREWPGAGVPQQLHWRWGSAKKSHSVKLVWPSFTYCAVTRRDGHATLPVPLPHP